MMSAVRLGAVRRGREWEQGAGVCEVDGRAERGGGKGKMPLRLYLFISLFF